MAISSDNKEGTECVTLLEKSKVHKTGSLTLDVDMEDYRRIKAGKEQ